MLLYQGLGNLIHGLKSSQLPIFIKSFIGTHPHPFIYHLQLLLSLLQSQYGCRAKNIKYLTLYTKHFLISAPHLCSSTISSSWHPVNNGTWRDEGVNFLTNLQSTLIGKVSSRPLGAGPGLLYSWVTTVCQPSLLFHTPGDEYML